MDRIKFKPERRSPILIGSVPRNQKKKRLFLWLMATVCGLRHRGTGQLSKFPPQNHSRTGQHEVNRKAAIRLQGRNSGGIASHAGRAPRRAQARRLRAKSGDTDVERLALYAALEIVWEAKRYIKAQIEAEEAARFTVWRRQSSEAPASALRANPERLYRPS
jgi:hypothetical protein